MELCDSGKLNVLFFLLLTAMTTRSRGDEPEGPVLFPLEPPYMAKRIEQITPDQEKTEEATPSLPEPEPKPEPKPELSPAMAALRDRVRKTLDFHQRQALSMRENTATELMHACLAFGCTTEVYRGGSPGKKLNGITCLCWNYPCAGYEPLTESEGHIAARIGYGLQEQPSQLLATLALAQVKATYPIRVGQDIRTVADLVEYEKLSCRSGTDLSLKLIGLACYAADTPSWKNGLGEEWSVERIIKEELAQPVLTARCGGTQRLLGLSYALYRRAKREQPIEGQYRRAKKFIDQFHDYALKVQNADGSWGPQLLAARGTSRNPATQLRSTGRVLEWLALSLPKDRLEDHRVIRSVEYVNNLLGSRRYRGNVKSLSTREIGSVMHALHALSVYDRRFFSHKAATAGRAPNKAATISRANKAATVDRARASATTR